VRANADKTSAFPTVHDLLLATARCPLMEAHLEGRGCDQGCRDVVLHHPNLQERDLRKPEERPIPEPTPRDELLGNKVGDHPSLRKPFRTPKPYWAADEVIDLHENHFDVWVKEDGITPLSGTSRRRATVPYWEFARDQARHLVSREEVRPGHDYALTEVVHCKSARERGVSKALMPCATRYLEAVLAVSPARVIVAGIRSTGGRTTYHGFKCGIITPNESRYTVWVTAVSSTRFGLQQTGLVSTSSAAEQSCLDYGGTWLQCFNKDPNG
jgi:hypothetical protein